MGLQEEFDKVLAEVQKRRDNIEGMTPSGEPETTNRNDILDALNACDAELRGICDRDDGTPNLDVL